MVINTVSVTAEHCCPECVHNGCCNVSPVPGKDRCAGKHESGVLLSLQKSSNDCFLHATRAQSVCYTTNSIFQRVTLLQIFSIVYMIEASIKIIGFGWTFYCKNAWNRFDFFLVMASLLDFILTNVGSSFGNGVFNVLRCALPVLNTLAAEHRMG